MDNGRVPQVTTGVVITVVGLLLLAGQLDYGWHFGRLWPVIFLALGVGRLYNSGGRSSWNGWWFIFLGVLFLLHTYRILELHRSWPFFIVWAGVSMMMRPRDRGRRIQP